MVSATPERAAVVTRTSAALGRTILKRWSAPDLKRAREVMPGIAADRWTQLGLDPDAVIEQLQQRADAAADGRVDELLSALTEPLVPRGWLNRLPEPTPVNLALQQELSGLSGVVEESLSGIEEEFTGVFIRIQPPHTHDEFGYLLIADTIAHGRVSNPPHAHWPRDSPQPSHGRPVFTVRCMRSRRSVCS